MKRVGTGAGNFNIIFQIGSARVLTFTFLNPDGSGYDISGKTLSFYIKKNKGDRIKLFNLTNLNGITVPVYATNQIRVDFSTSNTSREEGEYYWELRREDLNTPALSGLACFVYDSPQ
jgi:hypothetical protein